MAYAPAGEDADDRYLLVETQNPDLSTEDLLQVQAMVEALPEQIRGRVQKVDADTVQDMTVSLSDGRKIVWGGPDEPEFKVRVLDLLLRDKSTRSARTFDVSVPEAPTVKR